MRHPWIVLCALLSNIFVIGPARADELYRFVQVSCANDLHYFSARIVPIYNLPPKGRYLDKGLWASGVAKRRQEVREHFYDVGSLMKRPLRCRIPAAPLEQGWDNARPAISVDVIGRLAYKYNSNIRANVATDNSVQIIANGVAVATLDVDARTHISSVEVEADGVELVARICHVDGGAEAPLTGSTDVIRCTTKALPRR